ncbi:hypothetical protein ACQPU1_03955 [Clostridium paraputrificum]|uniref:hypothetical protein n=1 Tax=Clostridium TaxID=1485 RepID=UPI003D32DCA2
MAYSYTLVLSGVSILGFTATASNRTGADLTVNELSVQKLSGGTFTPITGLTIQGTATATSITVLFPSALLTTDLVLVQIIDGANKSQRVALDLATTLVNHSTETEYIYPSEEGSYTLGLDKVNGIDFSTADTETLNIGIAPTPDHSSITVTKPYLVKFTGQTDLVKITLNNASGDASEGAYEITFDAK